MIRFLASIFRGLSYVVGVSAPPPGQSERKFVFFWLGIIAIVVVLSVGLFYVVLSLSVS